MRVLIAPDKFAGTLSAHQAAEAIAVGWRRCRPHDELTLRPIADGGEGLLEVLENSLPNVTRSQFTIDPGTGTTKNVPVLELADGTIVIETAQIFGIAPSDAPRKPHSLSTSGLGKLIAAIATDRRLVIGLGGTGTLDGGAGMLQALGHGLHDADGRPIEPGLNGLAKLDRISPRRSPQPRSIVAAVDVATPIATMVRDFGKQKGLPDDELAGAERIIRRFTTLTAAAVEGAPSTAAYGTGAAGGLGYALAAYEGVEIVDGSAAVAALLDIPAALADSKLLITGEGRVDSNTLAGKGPWHLATLARSERIPVAVVAGTIEPGLAAQFDFCHDLGPDGMTRPAQLVATRSAELAHAVTAAVHKR